MGEEVKRKTQVRETKCEPGAPALVTIVERKLCYAGLIADFVGGVILVAGGVFFDGAELGFVAGDVFGEGAGDALGVAGTEDHAVD